MNDRKGATTSLAGSQRSIDTLAGSDRSLVYMDNSQKFIDLLSKFRESNKFDEKAF